MPEFEGVARGSESIRVNFIRAADSWRHGVRYSTKLLSHLMTRYLLRPLFGSNPVTLSKVKVSTKNVVTNRPLPSNLHELFYAGWSFTNVSIYRVYPQITRRRDSYTSSLHAIHSHFELPCSYQHQSPVSVTVS